MRSTAWFMCSLVLIIFCKPAVADDGNSDSVISVPFVFQAKQANVRLVNNELSCSVWVKFPTLGLLEQELRIQIPPPCDVMTLGPQYAFKPAIRSSSGTRPWFRVVGALAWEQAVRSECGSSWVDVEIDLVKNVARILPQAGLERIGYCPRRWDDDIYW